MNPTKNNNLPEPEHHKGEKMVEKESEGYLSFRAESILSELYSDCEYCVPYSSIGGKTPDNVAAIKELKENGMLEFHRGLMTEDGEVAGSGWCRSEKGNDYMDEFKL